MAEVFDLGILSQRQLIALVQVRGEAIMKFADAVLAIREKVEAGEIANEAVAGLVEWGLMIGTAMAAVEEEIVGGPTGPTVN